MCVMINDSETASEDQSIVHILQMLLIIKTAVIAALTKLTQNIHKDFKKLSYFIHRGRRYLQGQLKFNR